MRILAVDDEPSILSIIKAVLSRAGHDVSVMGNPEKAWRLFKASPGSFDLVISDITMPGITGRELAEAIRNLPSNVPIILMSGYEPASPGGKSPLTHCGFLPKPFTIRQLQEIAVAVESGRSAGKGS